jgi:hypothetical protein
MKQSRFACCAALVVVAAVVAAAALPATARAQTGMSAATSVTNQSDRQVWLTVYWGYKMTPGYHIQKATCLKPGESWHGSIGYGVPEAGPQIKVRAEVMNGDCRSGVFRDVDSAFNIPTNVKPLTPKITSTISGNNGNYSVKIQHSIF